MSIIFLCVYIYIFLSCSLADGIVTSHCLSCLSPFQVVDQVLDCKKVCHIDVRVRRGNSAHVGSCEHHRDDILVQDHEELLRDVVHADGVLERQVELVLLAEKVQAVVLIILGAIEVSTVAIDVNRGEMVDHVYQVLAANSAYTVREEYGRC